jgi:hypothetical protein
MALGSTQPLVNVSIKNIPKGKGVRCVRLTTSPLSRAECHEIWEHKPPGNLWATPGLLQDSLTLYYNARHEVVALLCCCAAFRFGRAYWFHLHLL